MDARPVVVLNETLTNGGVIQKQLPAQHAWTGFLVRIAGTVSGDATTVALNGVLNLIQSIQLSINTRPLWNINPAPFYWLNTWLQRTAGAIGQVTGANNETFNVSFFIPFALPWPVREPGSFVTALPAGLCDTIDIRIQAANDLVAALYSTAGTVSSFSSGPTVTIQAMQIATDVADLKAATRAYGHGLLWQTYTANIAAAGDLDQLITAGGLLKVLFCDIINNTLQMTNALTIATNQKLILGANDLALDSTFLMLQDDAKAFYCLETPPPGTWVHAFDRSGMPLEGLNLSGLNQVKLRSTYAAPTATATQHVITGVLEPQYIRQLLSPARLA